MSHGIDRPCACVRPSRRVKMVGKYYSGYRSVYQTRGWQHSDCVRSNGSRWWVEPVVVQSQTGLIFVRTHVTIITIIFCNKGITTFEISTRTITYPLQACLEERRDYGVSRHVFWGSSHPALHPTRVTSLPEKKRATNSLAGLYPAPCHRLRDTPYRSHPVLHVQLKRT